MSIFLGFHTAVRAMQQSQLALSVHGTNIAHASDSNYTRRTVTPPTATRVSGPGIQRIRDAYIDQQYRVAAGSIGDAETRQKILTRVEDIFGDPVNGGLRQAIDQFFDAWTGLADNPSDDVARVQVLTAGKTFAHQIRTTYSELETLTASVQEELVDSVDEANVLLNRIYELNKRISELQRHKMDDADLRDQRDLCLDQLARLTGASAVERSDGTVQVVVGSTAIPDGPPWAKIVLSEKGQPVWDFGNKMTPRFDGTGAIGALVQVRDGELKDLREAIAALGEGIGEAVNAIFPAEAKPFFVKVENGQIEVNPDLEPGDIVAGDLPTDGKYARQVAELADQALSFASDLVDGGAQSPRSFYRNLIGWVGIRAAEANLKVEVATAHLQREEEQRQSIWGVSLDEETANIELQQKAFAAAARVISVMDEMIDHLINMVG